MIHCLPGFLGRGADFDPFIGALGTVGFGPVASYDLFSQPPAVASLAEWAEQFVRKASADPQAVVMGYSLGGRLALHALVRKPRLWRAAVIISAHTGLKTNAERLDRLGDDAIWAERFKNDSWMDVLAAWNERAVFGKRTQPLRAQHDFVRAALVAGLREWSLGTQADLVPALAVVQSPVLWVVGSDDPRFRAIGERAVEALPNGRLAVISESAHRVHLDSPVEFIDEVTDFLREVGRFNTPLIPRGDHINPWPSP